MEDNKVRIKIRKELLESERKELKEEKKKKRAISILCFVFLFLGLIIGFTSSSLLRGSSIAAFKTNKLDKISSYFESVWLYKNNYEDLNETLQDKAFYGMTYFPEDVYTTYMSKQEIDDFATSINNNYVGIGAQYTYTNNVGTITRVFKDSPAEKGGLLAGDIIYSVNGETTDNLSSDDVKDRITGEEGTEVNITVIRSGKEIDLTFIRGPIEYTAYAEKMNDIIYLSIMSFGESTTNECIRYLNQYEDYSKLIIDLRDNSGGYQESVQSVAGLFLGKDVVVLNEKDYKGDISSYKTIVNEYFDNFSEIVVLINENTASAAEVLAIALQEMHPNTTLVGLTTYGKGVVQTSFFLEDGSALKITTYDWTSPKGKSINNVGVIPDVEVSLDAVLYESAPTLEDNKKYRYDSVSNYIKIAEMGLKYLDYDVDRTDGYFDKSFNDALNKFKADNGLTVDDTLDNVTYEAIISSVIRENSTNTDKDYQLQKAISLLHND